MPVTRVVVPGLARLPAFCHAVVADGWIHVSGTLGTDGDRLVLVPGGAAAETRQALRNLGAVLDACGAGPADLVKVQVFLADMDDYPAMNAAYLEALGPDVPARITVGRAALALGARVELDAVAYLGSRGVPR